MIETGGVVFIIIAATECTHHYSIIYQSIYFLEVNFNLLLLCQLCRYLSYLQYIHTKSFNVLMCLCVRIWQDLKERLKGLITAAPCMLFMKGTPQEPRCGREALVEHGRSMAHPVMAEDYGRREERRRRGGGGGSSSRYLSPAEFFPFSGFSRQMITILTEMHADYSTFNILADEKVTKALTKSCDTVDWG